MSETVLIVDDDPVQRRLLEAAVGKLGHSPVLADSGEKALALLQKKAGDMRVVVLDLVMPGMDGLEVLEEMSRQGIELPVIVQTAKGSVETAVKAMRAGAFDFVVKPVAPERLETAIGQALKVGALEGTNKRQAGKPADSFTTRDILTRSPSMERVIGLTRKAAASEIPVLLEGESGVGKGLIARAIRGESARRNKPFVTVNCGAIPENLVESILFGHEKGSFTGATEKHTGKFAEAHTGTLFLDEIGELTPDVQVKILRAVQEGEIEPVGSRETVRVDIRLISATNRDLIQRTKDGLFREDLYYRINVFPIMVPPLREHKEDIPLLVQQCIERFAHSGPHRISGISSRAMELLSAYDWPGNVRQLENAMFRAVVLAEGDVLTAEEFPQIRAQVEGIDESIVGHGDGPSQEQGPSVTMPGAEAARLSRVSEPGLLSGFGENGHIRTLQSLEEEVIRLAIERYHGQMSEVARRLGIGRSTLYRKLKEMGIDPSGKRDPSS